MVQDHEETENKPYADVVRGDDDVGEIVNGDHKNDLRKPEEDLMSLYSLICLMIGSILFPDSENASSSFLERIKNSVSENGPKLREALERTGREILLWTRNGSFLRSLFVITMGTITLLTTMALIVFTIFFIIATVNAIIISLLISLAIAGGFIALFFLCLTGIYIGALAVDAFIISTITVSAIVLVLIASGWIGFFYILWLGAKGILRLVKESVSVVRSAILDRHQHHD